MEVLGKLNVFFNSMVKTCYMLLKLDMSSLGLLMHMVGKMERMEGEDFYNDDWNIDEIEAKDEVSEDLKVLMEDLKNVKFNGQPVSMKF